MLQIIKNKIHENQQKTVAKIHNEFDTAQERLLNEAKEILNECEVSDRQITESLIDLGFTGTPTVKKNQHLISTGQQTKEFSDLILYYKQNYPFQKFLTENELERICKKYNLIFAPVAHYKKDVPVKNVKEITNAKPLENKLNPEIEIYSAGFEYSSIQGIEKKWFRENIGGGKLDPSKLSRTYNMYKVPVGGGHVTLSGVNVVEKTGLFIAAPKSHFNLKGLNKTGKFGFVQLTFIPNPDPIVFRYCKGGIQVLSKWGLEANDELLVNEISN